jgi:hypothetical protein
MSVFFFKVDALSWMLLVKSVAKVPRSKLEVHTTCCILNLSVQLTLSLVLIGLLRSYEARVMSVCLFVFIALTVQHVVILHIAICMIGIYGTCVKTDAGHTYLSP